MHATDNRATHIDAEERRVTDGIRCVIHIGGLQTSINRSKNEQNRRTIKNPQIGTLKTKRRTHIAEIGPIGSLLAVFPARHFAGAAVATGQTELRGGDALLRRRRWSSSSAALFSEGESESTSGHERSGSRFRDSEVNGRQLLPFRQSHVSLTGGAQFSKSHSIRARSGISANRYEKFKIWWFSAIASSGGGFWENWPQKWRFRANNSIFFYPVPHPTA